MSSWLVSKKANVLFFYSSWVILSLGVFFIFMLTPLFHQIEAMATGELLLRILGGTLGCLGVPAGLVILFGMAVFCVREDRSSIASKIGWFFVSFATACFGSALYFFTVYRKQVAVGGARASKI